jgi:hypothetical protein
VGTLRNVTLENNCALLVKQCKRLTVVCYAANGDAFACIFLNIAAHLLHGCVDAFPTRLGQFHFKSDASDFCIRTAANDRLLESKQRPRFDCEELL